MEIVLSEPHAKQRAFIESRAKRKVIRAGRRSGKTVGAAILGVLEFTEGNKRVLYAAPTSDQLERFWVEVTRALAPLVNAGRLYKNETLHVIERPRSENRIKAKTAWNADTLRGDYADVLILDEYQLMAEDTWEVVGAPMLLDNNGNAVFIYTPPSLHSVGVSKARDPRHAAKMFKKAQQDISGRWQTFHFSSHSNPYISETALADIVQDMSSISYRQEILAEDIDEALGALWNRELINSTRVINYPALVRIVVGVDPTGSRGNECGIVVAGLGDNGHGYILDDKSLLGSPGEWANATLTAFIRNQADMVVGETNYGGDMVESTIMQAAKNQGQVIRYKNVHASRGKAVRAEPVVANYEHGRIHHIGDFPYLEDEMVTWAPGESRDSPNRIDAMVWAITELMGTGTPGIMDMPDSKELTFAGLRGRQF